MATIKKDVPIRFGGLIVVEVTIESAVNKTADKGTHHYCTGAEDKAHDPTRIKQTQYCPAVGAKSRKRKGVLLEDEECGQTGYAWRKGREGEGGGVVLFAAEELDALTDPTVRESIVLTAHPLAQVLAATVPGEYVYYLRPSSKATEEAYAGLSAQLRRHPDSALLAVYATRTKPQVWRLQLLGDVITLQSLCWPEDLYSGPAVPVPTEAAESLQLMDVALANITTDFSAETYVNQTRLRLAEMLATKAELTPSSAPVTFLDQLRAEAAAISRKAA